MTRRFLKLSICCLALLGTCAPSVAQGKSIRFDVYFVAVGSSNYAKPTSASIHGFGDLPEAAKSAFLVARTFIDNGATSGLVLTPQDGHFVSVPEIYTALDHIHSEIIRDNKPHPLFLFYFAGHGISEGVGWSHFSVPGNILFDRDVAKLDVEKVEKVTLFAGDLVDRLESWKIPFLVLLDTCYEGKQRSFDSAVLSGTASSNLKDVASILRAVNEFRDSYPVLFSATPGTVVSTVADPIDPNSTTSVAPMSRRILVLLNAAERKKTSISLQEFVAGLIGEGVDSETTPAVTRSKDPNEAGWTLFKHGQGEGKLRESVATAIKVNLCCK